MTLKVDIPLHIINWYLKLGKSASIKYKSSNFSEKRRSQESKIFVPRPIKFYRCHADTCVLSKKRYYGFTNNKYLLVVADELTKYTFVEPVHGTSFNHQRQAWLNMFEKMPLFKTNLAEIITDGGSEFDSNSARAFFKEYGVKMIYIRRRKHIFSCASAIAENKIRKVCNALEKLIVEFPNTKFKDIQRIN